jgi:DNA polymerase-3 subunit beta
MKIIVLKTNLIEGLSVVEKGVSESASLPILKNFLLKAIDGEITLISTNLEIAVSSKISGKILEEGELVIPFSVFNSIVRNLNSEKISIESGKNNKIFIKTDNYEGIINDLDPKEFPLIPKIENDKNFIVLKTENLKNVFKNIIPTVQYSTIRPEISGIFIYQKEETLYFVGTDSFRLVEIKLTKNNFNSNLKDFSVIVPIKTCQEVVRMFNNSEEVKIFIDETQILFKGENEELISRLIDGTYPNYEVVIPKDFVLNITLNKNEFIEGIKLVSAFSGKTNDIVLNLKENQKVLEISSSDVTLGEGAYKIPIKIDKSEKFSIIFNWKYLLDGLRIYDSDEVLVSLNSFEKPAKISDPKNQNILYILMPIKG